MTSARRYSVLLKRTTERLLAILRSRQSGREKIEPAGEMLTYQKGRWLVKIMTAVILTPVDKFL